jgi:lysophospholipase L1-like esterase
MKSKITVKSLFCLGFFIFLIHPAFAQQHPPFWKAIQQFKHQDSTQMPPKHAILFIGSSSIRFWTDLQKDFPGHTVINRGFGGSTLPDVIRYAEDIIFPYHPKQIVIYCGDNDAASSDKISADSILNRFKHLFKLIRSKLPGTEVTYISIKPSPSREKFFPVMQKANWEIRLFLKNQQRADFVDIWHLMLNDYGQPRKGLFRSDMLHMNKKGYAIWTKAIKPVLLKG